MRDVDAGVEGAPVAERTVAVVHPVAALGVCAAA